MATYAVSVTHVSGWRARVSVTVTSPTPGATMTVYRVVGDVHTPVAGMIDIPAVSVVGDDAEAPLTRTMYYRVEVSDAGAATSGLITLGAALPVLSDPFTAAWVAVDVTEWGEASFGNRSDTVQIEGSPHVVVLYDVEVDPTRALAVHTRTIADDAAVSAMAAGGRPLLLRWPTDNGEADAWLHPVGGRRRYRYTPYSEVVRHSWPTMQVVQGDPTRLAQGDTLGDLAEYVMPGTTLAAIAAEFSTLGQIALTDLRAV